MADEELPVRLNRASAIERLGGHDQIYQQVLEMFQQMLPQACADIGSRLQAGQRSEAARLAHSMKGSAGAVGAERLLLRAAQAERALTGAAGDDAAQAAVATLLEEAQALLAELRGA